MFNLENCMDSAIFLFLKKRDKPPIKSRPYLSNFLYPHCYRHFPRNNGRLSQRLYIYTLKRVQLMCLVKYIFLKTTWYAWYHAHHKRFKYNCKWGILHLQNKCCACGSSGIMPWMRHGRQLGCHGSCDNKSMPAAMTSEISALQSNMAEEACKQDSAFLTCEMVM